MKRRFNLTVCASGGGGNFAALAENQGSAGYRIGLLVVDRVCGAIDKAEQHGIAHVLLDPRRSSDSLSLGLDKAVPGDTDLIVLAGFLPILSGLFCKKWDRRIINTHPSLLPKYGGKGMVGVKVQEAVLKNNETVAGCTVHYVNEKIDGGEIILQKAIAVRRGESAWELGGRVFAEETKLLVEAVELIMRERMADDV